MSEKPSDRRIYFEHLDVVRFFAAFLIVIVHAYEGWKGWFGEIGFLSGGTYKELTPFGKLVDQFVGNFGIGVDIFFLISGFLITYILLEERKRHGKIHIGKFMIRRTLRIWPLYYFLIILGPFLVSWVDVEAPHYLANALFIANFEIIQSEKWLFPFSHFWSICVEEHFYLVWPFIIQMVSRNKMLTVFSAVILSSIAFRLYSSASMTYPWYTIYLHTISRIDVMAIGAIGAFFYSRKPFIFQLSRFIRYSIIALLIVIFAMEPVGLWDSLITSGFKKYVYIGLFGILLLDYNFNPNFKHLLPKKSIIHYLGKVSYGIYMYHNIIILVVIKKIMWRFDSTNMWLYFGLIFSLSLIIPILSYELFEKHFLKISKRFRVVKTDR